MDVSFNQAASLYDAARKMQTYGLGDNAAGNANPLATNEVKPEFLEMVGESLNQAIQTGYKAEGMSSKALVGQTNINDLVTAISNAELTLNTIVTVRDKVISAYQDIIRMPI